MAGRACYHCKQWVEAGEAHDCWSTTERALTQDLSEDLREAWLRLREAASELGEQRIYASHQSIMFARKTCYAFVRPKRSFLELCIFLNRTVRSPRVRRAIASSKRKVAHIIQVRHRDEVETPLTDWLHEAYHLQDAAAASGVAKGAATSATPTTRRPRAEPTRRRAQARRTE
jgi:hypothetical protein